MPGKKKRTSRLLILISVFLCLLFGATLTQSSPMVVEFSDDAQADVIVAEGVTDAGFSAEDLEQKNSEEDLFQEDNTEAEPQATPTGTPKPESDSNASPEAEKGQWVADGDKWRFEVDGTSHIGWLRDTDGHTYFFNKKGYMQTGWLNNNGKRYYFDEDGIMQTGEVPIEGKVYLFLEDGSLDGYAKPTPAPTKAPDPTPTPTAAPFKAETLDNGEKPAVALTFDDGPGAYADRILDCLEKYKAKATFFMIGEQIANFPDQVKRMDALGCELGNHTFHHKNLTKLTPEEISEEIGNTDMALLDLVGHGATVLRPPYGAIDDNVTAAVGTPMVLWSIDTLDWETKNVDQTVQAVVDNVQDGSIILMHEIYEESAQATEILVPKLIDAGYDLLTVHELAQRHGVDLQTGIAYGELRYE